MVTQRDSLSGLDEFRGLLQSQLAGLRPSEASVIRIVIDDPQFVIDSTTAALAARAEVSAPTVVRAARGVGFTGFSDLKLGIARARGSAQFYTPPETLDAASDLNAVQQTVLASSHAALNAVVGALDLALLDRAVDAIDSARQVQVVGSGTSSAVAVDVAFRLSSVGIPALHVLDQVSAVVAARLLERGDVMLAISATGRTPQTLALADAAKSGGATLLAITNQVASPLAKLADLPLIAGGEDVQAQMAAAASRIAHLAIIDMLLTTVALRSPERMRRAEIAGIGDPVADE